MPTPVSALIHAATMVTAGVYLLMRSSPLIEYSVIVLMVCLILGTVTTIFSSLIGLFQQDIKKVIAYSTMSQLGMMVIAVGLSSYNLALFHLINHAFYKALLFLGAGSVIHAVADNQDFRRYGGLLPFLPLTYSVMLIASLSLVAFPYMTGFYSKDFVLESAFGKEDYYGNVVYTIASIGAMFTTLYSLKVLYLTFLTNPNGPVVNYKQAHEGDIFMSLPAGWCRKSHAWVKLANSGDLLKLLVPSNIWKSVCGWNNYSDMVTNQKMILPLPLVQGERWTEKKPFFSGENEMDNRGSKLTFYYSSTYHRYNVVKEQRVDASWYKRNPFMSKVYSNGCGNILSSQNPFLKKIYTGFSSNLTREMSSISIKKPGLHPYFVTGFSDGESYFSISLIGSSKMSTGWVVNLQFGIKLHKKDRYLLELIKDFFMGIGSITSHGKDAVQFRVSSVKDLQIIVDHFKNFPLITQKWSDFQLFKYAFELVKSKNHLTPEGLIDIVSVKAAMNLGLSKELQVAFLSPQGLVTQQDEYPEDSRLYIIARPLNPNKKTINPYWLAGFVSAEGNFFVNFINSNTKVGKQVILVFSISQHSRDATLLQLISEFLDCGKYYPSSTRNEGNYTVTKFSDIEQRIIPFFLKYPIKGVKSLDLSDFLKIASLIKEKEHLTEQGLAKIESIKSGMNTKRIH